MLLLWFDALFDVSIAGWIIAVTMLLLLLLAMLPDVTIANGLLLDNVLLSLVDCFDIERHVG